MLHNRSSSRVTRIRLALSASGAALLSAALLACTGIAAAQDYPSRPIRLVVGFPPGGSNDLVARVIAPRLAESLGAPVVIENRPGANATIGTAFVATAAPDGYVLTLGSVSPLVLSPFTYEKLAYDTQRDFAGVSTVALTPEVIALHPSVPVRTMKELIALARKRQISLGSAGNGGLPHLAIELLKNASKTPFLHVPFKGAAPAVSDAVAGHIDGIIMDLPAASTMIREGRLRAIAITNSSRSPVLPDTPTSVEQGFPAVNAVNWFALMAPAKTPRPVLDRLHKALIGVTQLAPVREQFAKMGIEPFTQPSPDAFARFLADEMVRWGALVKSSGAKASD